MTVAAQRIAGVASVADVDETVAAAVVPILDRLSSAGRTERVPLAAAHGRTLAEDVVADRDQPPFDRAAMDGIAMHAGAEGPLRVVGVVAAGGDVDALRTHSWSDPDACVEIMTGAAVPREFDAVVRYEDLTFSEDDEGARFASFTIPAPGAAVTPRSNIHPRASDYPRGAGVAHAGERIGSAHMAVLASCGHAEVAVTALPRIELVATGDELVDPNAVPRDHQIRASNGVSIAAELGAWGFPVAESRLVADDRAAIRTALDGALSRSDVLLVSGAVSRGKYDSVPELLADLGVEITIHGVRQRPGKPLLVGTRDGTLVIGLPGNPVSSLVSVRRYLIPALAGAGAAGFPVELGEELRFPKPLTWFPALRLERRGGGLVALPVAGNGSGDFSHLAGSSGIGVVPEEADALPAGRTIWFYPWG